MEPPIPLHTNWTNVPVQQVAEGISRQMIVGQSLMMCRLTFAPNVVTAPHSHPHEQITLVERGSVLYTVGEEQRLGKPGDVFHFPSGAWHGATILDEEVVLVDLFTPLREDFLKG